MVYDGIIEGRFVRLISCAEEDAEFTRALRMDPKLEKCFPIINNTVEQQREWIRKQREKEGDYFFVVRNKADERIGTIAVYNIVGDVGEGGRIIIPSQNVAEICEAQLLLSEFAFYTLGLRLMTGFVYADNKRAVRYNKLFSGRLFSPTIDLDGRSIIRLETTAEDFEKIKQRVKPMIYRD